MDDNKKVSKNNIFLTAQSWCLRNGVLIYAVPLSNTKVKIVIDYKGEIIHGKEEYASKNFKVGDKRWWTKISELYIYYYDRRDD